MGTTLAEVVAALRPRKRVGVKVVQLLGSVGCLADPSHANELARRTSELGGEWHLLPALQSRPTSGSETCQIGEPSVSVVLEMARHADIALVGIGRVIPPRALCGSAILPVKEAEAMRKGGAVGEICCRFFDREGRAFQSEFDRRVVSITLEELRGINTRIGVAGGPNKAGAILGALRGRYVNTLITDEVTAREILELDDRKDRCRSLDSQPGRRDLSPP